MSIKERIYKVIEQQLDIPQEQIREDSSFIDDLGADSLAIVEVTLALEEEFELDIPDDVVDSCVTVGDAIKAAESALRAMGRTST